QCACLENEQPVSVPENQCERSDKEQNWLHVKSPVADVIALNADSHDVGVRGAPEDVVIERQVKTRGVVALVTPDGEDAESGEEQRSRDPRQYPVAVFARVGIWQIVRTNHRSGLHLNL